VLLAKASRHLDAKAAGARLDSQQLHVQMVVTGVSRQIDIEIRASVGDQQGWSLLRGIVSSPTHPQPPVLGMLWMHLSGEACTWGCTDETTGSPVVQY